MDEGGYGVPQKIGKVNMDGTNPVVLLSEVERPEAITIDLDEKMLYYSTQYPSQVIQLMLEYIYTSMCVCMCVCIS